MTNYSILISWAKCGVGGRSPCVGAGGEGGGISAWVGPNTRPNDVYSTCISGFNKLQFGCEFIVREFEHFPA